jgi:hypothetical protein
MTSLDVIRAQVFHKFQILLLNQTPGVNYFRSFSDMGLISGVFNRWERQILTPIAMTYSSIHTGSKTSFSGRMFHELQLKGIE